MIAFYIVAFGSQSQWQINFQLEPAQTYSSYSYFPWTPLQSFWLQVRLPHPLQSCWGQQICSNGTPSRKFDHDWLTILSAITSYFPSLTAAYQDLLDGKPWKGLTVLGSNAKEAPVPTATGKTPRVLVCWRKEVPQFHGPSISKYVIVQTVASLQRCLHPLRKVLQPRPALMICQKRPLWRYGRWQACR